jgi:hypothetical protein
MIEIKNETYRLAKRNEVLPKQGNESFYNFIERVGGGRATVNGRIGYSGTKTHRLAASWIPAANGDKVIIDAYSYCGSQRFGSGLSITFAETVTCKKCGA